MQKKMYAALMCAFLSLSATAQSPNGVGNGNAQLTSQERTLLVDLLERSAKEFLESVEHLNDAQWSFKPGPDRWSVAEVAEHLQRAETALFAAARNVEAEAPASDWEARTRGKTELLQRALLNREAKVQAPEILVPRHDLTRAEIMAGFKKARAETLKFARETNAPLKMYVRDHPFPMFGALNAYQWVLYIPLHTLRHNGQIAEVKASAGFPRP